MARPHVPRRVSDHLEGRLYKPQGVPAHGLEREFLTLDGLEALRLADVEGLYQEEAARRMGISRATFARTLLAAHQAVARALVGGHALEIGGGSVQAGPEGRWPCPVHGEERRGRGCRCRGSGRGRRKGGARKGKSDAQ